MTTASDRKSSTVSNADVERRARGAYLGLAIGDALGATVEFMTPREIRAQYQVHDVIRGGGWLRLKAGQITDDTEMSLALGTAILAQRAVTAEAAAEAFSEWMRSKPVDIGHTVRRGIAHYRRTGDVAVPYDEYTAGNGAAMRVLPVALAMYGHSAQAVREATLAQAHVTHNSLLSDLGTLFVVELVQRALGGESWTALKQHVDDFVQTHPQFEYRSGKRVENPSGFIVDTLQSVFQALFLQPVRFASGLVDVVNRGGDADTTGAIAGMIAGAHWGIDAIPLTWLQRLEGRVASQCARQAVELIGLASALQPGLD